MNKKSFFLISLLSILSLTLVFLVVFERRYSDADIYLKMINHQKMQQVQSDLKLAIKNYEIDLLAGERRKRVPASIQNISFELKANTLFAELKQHHKQNDCIKVSEKFREIQSNYSFSPFFVEALFLSADCQMQTRNYDQALLSYSGLIDLYPDHIATGHAILKMVEILRLLDRQPEALEALKVLKRHFSDRPEIIKAAQDMATDMGRSL